MCLNPPLRNTRFNFVGDGAHDVPQKRLDRIGQAFCLFKIEEFFKLFIQGNTQYKSKFGGGAELSGFNGADRVSGYADKFCKLGLR